MAYPQRKPKKKLSASAPTSPEDLALRRRCQTDLFFLAKEVLGYELITENTHRQLAEFFVQKDPDKPLIEQSEKKHRLLLFPRGCFKSTFNIADTIQWILCFPNIRILILTAGSSKAESLADAFVDEVQSYFVVQDEPTELQRLFPEFCITEQDKKVGSYTAPHRTRNWKEPTLMSSTIDSTLSGWHYEVIKCDDVVSNRNSTTLEGLQKTTKNLHINRKMLRPGHYYDLVGTRYSPADAYGDAIERGGANLLILHKPAMWLTDAPDQRVTAEDIKTQPKEAWTLLFPEEWPYESLIQEFNSSESAFFSQMMNDPVQAGQVVVTIEDMRKATVPDSQIPPMGDVRIIWDLAYSVKKGRDFSAAMVAKHVQGKIFFVDAERGRFPNSELAYKIVTLSHKWGLSTCGIEDAIGCRFLEPEILRVAKALGLDFSIDWISIERNRDDKNERFKSIQPLISDGRMRFSASMPYLDRIYAEFCNFYSIEHKDLADAASRHLRYLVYHSSTLDSQQEIKASEAYKKLVLHQMLYGEGRFAPKPAIERNPWALDDVLGGLNG